MLGKITDYLRRNWQIATILVIAVLLRVWQLGAMPPSLNWDEASHGYNAYSILKTGKDEWGRTLPLIFRAYGDYKLPGYIYATVVSVAIFGLSGFSIRLPSVVAGTALVLLTYLLTERLMTYGQKAKSKNANANRKLVALVAALLVAVEPWSLFLSRGAFEANLATAFFALGFYLFLAGLKNHKRLLLSALFFGLTVWTYNSYRIFTPISIAVLLLVYRRQLSGIFKNEKKVLAASFAVLLLFLIPMGFQLASSAGQARYDKVAILDAGAINKIIELRNQHSYAPVIERLLYNRPAFFVKTVVANWTKYFTGDFLFLRGGDQYQYNVQNYGLLYIVNLPFFLMGILYLFSAAIKNKGYARLMLVWLILAPVAGSITRDSPHTLRAVTFLPLPMIVSAYGLGNLVERVRVRPKVIYGLYILIVGLSLFWYLADYFGEYKKTYSQAWQYGYSQAVSFAKQNYDSYDKIIFTKKYGEPHIFILLNWPWDPAAYRTDDNLVRYYQDSWYWVDKFDKFYFVNDWDIPRRSDEDFVLESGEEFDCDFDGCLLITSPGNVHVDWKLVKTINFLDGQPAFEIYKNH